VEKELKLNLGCGAKKLEGYVNIDKNSKYDPDVLVDIEVDGLPYERETCDLVVAKDFLEHILPENTIFVIEEIWRVLKIDCEFEHYTPSTDGRGAFQDPTHRSFWNFNSWNYFVVDDFREQIGTKAKFEVVQLKDHLTSDVHQIIHTHGIFKKVRS